MFSPSKNSGHSCDSRSTCYLLSPSHLFLSCTKASETQPAPTPLCSCSPPTRPSSRSASRSYLSIRSAPALLLYLFYDSCLCTAALLRRTTAHFCLPARLVFKAGANASHAVHNLQNISPQNKVSGSFQCRTAARGAREDAGGRRGCTHRPQQRRAQQRVRGNAPAELRIHLSLPRQRRYLPHHDGKALLWTDGRYWLAAEEEKYPEFDLLKQGQPEVPSLEEWIAVNLGSKAVVGMSPYVATVAEWERLSKKIHLRPVANIVQDMMPPEKSVQKMYVRPAEFCGATCQERRAAILAELEKEDCDLIILSALDEIAWLTNLRGGDVDYNPVFYAYAVIDKHYENVRLYVNPDKVTDAVRQACEDHIDFYPYEQFEADLKQLPRGRKALVDERQTSEAVFRILKDVGTVTVRVVCGPAQKLKGIKNEVELKGFRDCHVRDGAALTRYLAWLHDQVANKGVTNLNEYDAATKLEEFRAQGEHFVQLSFGSISSIGPNGAMCHYSPAETGSAAIRNDQLYLIDSGAHYWDGTTDVTRTICFTAPSDEQREAYTLVLKGHIALNSLVFPKGTSGARLDTLARMALWGVGLDYAHGTGHGVGSFLNVHEGPHGIGIRPVATGANMELHSIVSNEPGYYKDGHYGIRIENLEEVVECRTKYSATGFYTMSHLTMAPLCRDLIDVSLLTETERAWVDRYHAKVVASIMPHLQQAGDQNAVEYLKYHTQSLFAVNEAYTLLSPEGKGAK